MATRWARFRLPPPLAIPGPVILLHHLPVRVPSGTGIALPITAHMSGKSGEYPSAWPLLSWSVLLLMFLGLALMIVATVYSVRHPRAAGEAFTPRRKFFLCMNIFGAALVIIYALFVSGWVQ
ncbi:hypothetical protein AAIH25_15250 [Arthrobacter crystallopoietes]|uniref:hypothetical protein n=1 Tax=Crystallibacter crystallopoietes TaxID=37928 RepID=UPI003D1C2CB8